MITEFRKRDCRHMLLIIIGIEIETEEKKGN